jgi:hypothetical protein
MMEPEGRHQCPMMRGISVLCASPEWLGLRTPAALLAPLSVTLLQQYFANFLRNQLSEVVQLKPSGWRPGLGSSKESAYPHIEPAAEVARPSSPQASDVTISRVGHGLLLQNGHRKKPGRDK